MTKVFTAPCGKSHIEQHEAAYALLHRAAVSLFPDLLPDASIQKTEKGKPYFPDHPDIRFSISHTPGMVAVAIGDVPCGIDVEEEKDFPEEVRIRFFPSVPPENALTAWTEREAYGKLTGEGFFCTRTMDSTVRFSSFTEVSDSRYFLITVCFADASM